MPAYRPDPTARPDPSSPARRTGHSGIPAQNRRILRTPDGVSKVGRSAIGRHGGHRVDPPNSSDGVMVPRGFPIGDPGYRAAQGRADAGDVAGVAAGNIADDVAADQALRTDPARLAREAFEAEPEPEPVRPAVTPRPAEGRVLQRVGTGRAPFRSAVVGGVLLAAVLGAGVAAWAMAPSDTDSDDVVITQVDEPGANQSATPADPTAANPTQANPTAQQNPTVQNPAEQNPAQQNPAGQQSAQVIPSPTGAPPVDLGPATVSAVLPGDPGFGWPSTAFGLPPAPTANQP